jgi:hypothetical protein
MLITLPQDVVREEHKRGTQIKISFLIATCFHAGILLGLFDPEDGGEFFLRNVD